MYAGTEYAPVPMGPATEELVLATDDEDALDGYAGAEYAGAE